MDLAKVKEVLEKCGVVNKLTPEMIVVVVRVSDWNPQDNEHWESEDNRSFPRDIKCEKCNEQVVMSQWAYNHYLAMEQKPRVICCDCIVVDPDKQKISVKEDMR